MSEVVSFLFLFSGFQMKIAVLLLLLVTVCFVATSGRRRFLPTVADAADATDFLVFSLHHFNHHGMFTRDS